MTPIATKVAACVAPSTRKLNDKNGKKCGVTDSCKTLAVEQQRSHWNLEAARANKVKEAARVIAKKSMMPDSEIHRARTLRL